MNNRLIIITCCVVLALFAGIQMKNGFQSAPTFGKTDIVYGANGGDVYELQGRLKFLGYYNGRIDGDYGYQTLRAVKDFQYKFGMRVDGVVGSKTKLKLWEATKAWRPTAPARSSRSSGSGGERATGGGRAINLTTSNRLGFSEQDLRYMANAVYGESRGEPYEGQVAVAAVILNRIKSPSFPNTPYGVIFQPGAFTAVADGQIFMTPNNTARRAVRDAINGWDPTHGCIYYFNPATATSKWIWSRPQYKRIGEHIFCR
jgi:N-acetylmuramoyl-L-alanine amidase